MAIFSGASIAAAWADAHEEKAALIELANEAAEYARSIAPVGVPPDLHPGEYRDSIHVVTEGDKVKVRFGSEISNLVEYGSIHNPEFAIRARTEVHFNNQ